MIQTGDANERGRRDYFELTIIVIGIALVIYTAYLDHQAGTLVDNLTMHLEMLADFLENLEELPN